MTGKIMYWCSLPFLYGLSLLPFALLYRVSDVFYVLVYHLLGYRKPVVRENLRNSFPEKSDEQRLEIEKQFYRYFCDLTLETFKLLTIRPSTLRKRVRLAEDHAVLKFARQNKSVVIVCGHFGNWEWLGARFSLESLYQLFIIYRPLQNEGFDRLFVRMRSRQGSGLYTMNDAFRGMLKNRDRVTATAFLTDQNASRKSAWWTTFLNQDTAVFTGAERIARKLGQPVIYLSVSRPRRGYYEVTPEILCEEPAATSDGEISALHTQRLEADILRQPEIWLWSHRRWKHQRDD